MIQKFEDIVSWQKSKELTLIIYKKFKQTNDFGFRDQVQRAAVSIMNNIAEGFDRGSNKDFIRFLYIAKASTSEVRSMLYVALELNYITQEEFTNTYKLTLDINMLIGALIKSLS